MEKLYFLDGRHNNPSHPHANTFTGLGVEIQIRNRVNKEKEIADKGMEATKKLKPSPYYNIKTADSIKTASFDDLELIKCAIASTQSGLLMAANLLYCASWTTLKT